MRDDSYLRAESETDTEPDEAKAASIWRSRAITGIGALLSLAILAALVIWSYRLGVRDTMAVPVIQAELGATKERPADPGGLEVAHQGRTVYEILTGEESLEGVTLAPSEETLAAEDTAPARPLQDPEDVVVARPAPEPVEETAPPAQSERTAETIIATPLPAPTPKPETAETTTTEPEAVEEPAAETPTEAAQIETAVEAVVGGLIWEEGTSAPRQAPTPTVRPARTAPTQAPQALPEPRAAALASRIQIQLGAFNSEDIAAQQWEAAKTRNGDLLAGRGRVITPVLSGGRRLFRLRAGPFENVDEASSLCRALKARDEQCIVARAQ
ncbi:MAG: SPOR domain-containing protein [Pseudomonadota bacterium]